MLAAPSAISASGAPSATPAAIAARALVRLWRLGEGEVEGLAPGRGRDQRLGDAVLDPALDRLDVAAGAEAEQAAAPRSRCGSSSPASTGTTAVPSAGSAAEQLGLGRGDRLDRAEQLDVDRADVGDHRRPRARRSPPARRSGRRPRIAISSTSISVSGGRLEHRQRQPDLGVEVLAVGVDRAGQQRPGDVLDRGLADRAGDPDDARAQRPPPGARPAPAAPRAGPRPRRPSAARRGPAGAAPGRPTTTPQAPACDRRGGELAAVARSRRAGRRRGRPRRLASESITARARRARRRPRRATSAPIAAAISLGAEPHAGARRSFAQLLAGDLAVVEGILRPSSNSWPCSWPLPAMTTVSPGSARARARARSRPAGRARPRPRRRPRSRRGPRRRSPPGPRSAGCRR